jgi:RNase H-fold protein (predicted Holliday junction resolvase)
MSILAVDPGRDKCGMAVLSAGREVLWRQVVETAALTETAREKSGEFGITLVVLGNGTTSQEAEGRLREALPQLPVKVVDEYRTTEEAKKLYWQVNPPKGWRRFLPTTMQVPPEPVDDLVAVILARRELGAGS